MSRIGRVPIPLPAKVDVSFQGLEVTVKGPRGTLAWELPDGIQAAVGEGAVVVARRGGTGASKALHGLARAMIQNLVVGVSSGFVQHLKLEGLGYRAKVEGKKLVMTLGFTKPVEIAIPDGIAVEVSKKQDEVVLGGIDKQILGEFVARLRRIRPPEPYKGKGILYKGEVIRRKAGKKVSA